MATFKKTFISDERIGKEEINFPEFPLGICSQQQPKKMPTKLEFHDLAGADPVKVTVFPSSYGYPNQFTRDLLRALMRITYRKNRFRDPKVETSIREILKELGIQASGQSLDIVKKNLRILAGTRIEYEKSFFDKRVSDRIKTTLGVNIISSYIFQEADSVSQQKELGIEYSEQLKSGIFWNKEFFEMSLKDSKNLIDFDYTYYISLENNITKELYLLLNKRAYSKPIFKIGLRVLAFEKLGMSRTLENKLFKVRQQLKKAHEELIRTGFLSRTPVFIKENSVEYVSYFFTANQALFDDTAENTRSDIPNTSHLSADSADLKQALIDYGYNDAEIGKFFKKFDLELIRKSIVLCSMQKRITNRKKWLYKCLSEGYDLSDVDALEASQMSFSHTKTELQSSLDSSQLIQKAADSVDLQIELWISQNQTQYELLTQENLAYIQENDTTMFKSILKTSRSKKITPFEVLRSSKMYNHKVRSIIQEYL